MTALCQFSISKRLSLGLLMSSVLLFSYGRVDAQSLRDPTLPPVDSGLASPASGAKSLNTEPSAMTVIVRKNRPYLVVDTRLYTQGQKLGKAQIVRISETEIWFREDGVVRKVPRFTGIQRRNISPVAARTACKSSSSKTQSSVASCADVQP